MKKPILQAIMNMERLRELASFFSGTRGISVAIGIATDDELYISIRGKEKVFNANTDSDAILALMDELSER